MPAPLHPQKSSQLAGVDLIKYLMAFCVVAIHFRANYVEAGHDNFAYPIFFDWLIRLAVPFFFMATGFLLQRKLSDMDSAPLRRRFMLQRCRKVLKMWALWNLVYLPLVIYYFFYFRTPLLPAIKLYVNMICLYGGIYCAFPLWYLYSLIFITLTIALLQPLRHYRLYLLLIFSASILLRWLFPEPDNLLLRLNNRLIGYAYGGGFAFLAGMFAYTFRAHLNLLCSSAFLILSAALKFYSLNLPSELPFIPQLGAIGLFGIALTLSKSMPEASFISLRRQSMWIYFTHMIIIALFFKILDLQTLIPSPWLYFLLTQAAAALLAYILSRLTPHSRALQSLI